MILAIEYFIGIVILLSGFGFVSACRSDEGTDEAESDSFEPVNDGGDPDAGPFDSETGDENPTDSDTGIPDEVCEALSALHGTLFCANSIWDEETFDALTATASGIDRLTLTKYVMGVDDALPVPLSFMNVNIHRLHYDFLVAAFPELFEGISPVQYLNMAMDGASRRLFVGSLALYVSDGEPFYGFTVLDDASTPDAVIRVEQIARLYTEMSSRFSIGTLKFVPETAAQKEAVADWPISIPIAGADSQIRYEAYTAAEGYGTIRIMSLNALHQATETGNIGFQDILVLDEAPSDLEKVVSGTITGTRQGILSHLNVRSSARGTPNCYVRNPRELLAKWEGRLVRLVCGEDALDLQEATLEAAEAAWNALRPEPLTLPPLDVDYEEITPLSDIPSETANERAAALLRFGAKAANLAALYRRIDPSLALDGFAVPFAWYSRYMEENHWTAETDSGTKELSFADTIQTWLEDASFKSDSAVRRFRLLALQEAVRSAPVDANLLNALEAAFSEVFDSDKVMVRFRSSGNAEDSLTFSGAGLYESVKACAADETDSDTAGPSLCDSDEDKERALSTALKKVWASLWNPAAFEERSWYGIDHRQVAMGILVNTRTRNEAADIVAFTGNPLNGAPDYLVNAQLGEWDVVTSEPGVFPETTLLEMDGNEVTAIRRVSASSQTSPGETVLSDAALKELGAHLADIASVFPMDAPIPFGAVLFYDSEWKLTEDGSLVVKQIRPYLFDNVASSMKQQEIWR